MTRRITNEEDAADYQIQREHDRHWDPATGMPWTDPTRTIGEAEAARRRQEQEQQERERRP